MKKSTKLLSTAVACSLALASLAGCGGEGGNSASDTSLKWYVFANEANTNADEVYEAASKLIKENVGADVTFVGVPSGEYEAKMQVLNAAAEQVDIMFVSNWANNYYTNISKNTLLPLDDLLKTSAPTLYSTLPDYLWEGAKVNGKIYAVPNQQIAARETRFAIPEQNAALLGIDPAEYFAKEQDYKASLDDVETYLKLLNEKTNTYAQLEKVWEDGVNFFGIEEILGSYLPGAIRYSDGELKLINQYESEEFKYYINKRREWVKAGLVQNEVEDKRALPGIDDPSTPIPALLRVNTYKPGVETDLLAQHKFKPAWLIKSKGILTSGGIVATMNGITSTCKNPELAIKVLEYVNTNPEVYNLLSFGIEGKNYTKVADNRIEKSKDTPYEAANWSIGNVFISYLLDEQTDDTWEQTKLINDSAERSPLLGFNPNLDSLKTQTAGCKSAIDEFLEALDYGIVDIDEAYPQFIEKLNAAGADKIIEEVQRQIDEWQKTK